MRRFIKYVSVTVPTFLLDVCILYTLVDVLDVPYVRAAGVAFFIATSANYLLSRAYVFQGTHRDPWTGYAYFLIIATCGLAFVTSLMWLFVYHFDFHYIVSRLIIGALEGIWNYLMNLYFNFRVAQAPSEPHP